MEISDIDPKFAIDTLKTIVDAEPGTRPVLYKYEDWDSPDTQQKVQELRLILGALMTGWAVGRIDFVGLVATPDEYPGHRKLARLIIPNRTKEELTEWWLDNLNKRGVKLHSPTDTVKKPIYGGYMT